MGKTVREGRSSSHYLQVIFKFLEMKILHVEILDGMGLRTWAAALERRVWTQLHKQTLDRSRASTLTICKYFLTGQIQLRNFSYSHHTGKWKETGRKERILLLLDIIPSYDLFFTFDWRSRLRNLLAELKIYRNFVKLRKESNTKLVFIHICCRHLLDGNIMSNTENSSENLNNAAMEGEIIDENQETLNATLVPATTSSSVKRRRDGADDTMIENEIRNESWVNSFDFSRRRNGVNSLSDRALDQAGNSAIDNSTSAIRFDTAVVDLHSRLDAVDYRTSQQDVAIDRIENVVREIHQLVHELRGNREREARPVREAQEIVAHQPRPVENIIVGEPGLAAEDLAYQIRATTGLRGAQLFQTFWERKNELTLSQVLITPGNYPHEIADVNFCSDLRLILGTANNTMIEGCRIILHGTDSKQGALVVNCGNLGTLVWVKNFAAAKHFNCGLIGDIQLAPTFKVWTQSSSTTFDSLKAELNNYVRTECWRLIKTYPERTGSRFLFIGDWGLKERIDNYLDEIQRRGRRSNNEMKIFCGSYSSPVAIHYLSSPFGNIDGKTKLILKNYFSNFLAFKMLNLEVIWLWKLPLKASVIWKLLEEREFKGRWAINQTTCTMMRICKLARLGCVECCIWKKQTCENGNKWNKGALRTVNVERLLLTSFEFDLLKLNGLCYFEHCGLSKDTWETHWNERIFGNRLETQHTMEVITLLERANFFFDRTVSESTSMDKSKQLTRGYQLEILISPLLDLSDSFQRNCSVDKMATSDDDIDDFQSERDEMKHTELAKEAMRKAKSIVLSTQNNQSDACQNEGLLALLKQKEDQLKEFTAKMSRMQTRLNEAHSPKASLGSASLKRKLESTQRDLIAEVNLSGLELEKYISEAGNLATCSTMCITYPEYPLHAMNDEQSNDWIKKLNSVYKNDDLNEIDFAGTNSILGVLEVSCRNLNTIDALMKFCSTKNMICVPKGALKVPNAYSIFVPQKDEAFDTIKKVLGNDFVTDSWAEIKRLFSRNGSKFLFIANESLEVDLKDKGEIIKIDGANRKAIRICYKAFQERGWLREWVVSSREMEKGITMNLNLMLRDFIFKYSQRNGPKYSNAITMKTTSIDSQQPYLALVNATDHYNHFLVDEPAYGGRLTLGNKMYFWELSISRKRKKRKKLKNNMNSRPMRCFALLLPVFTVLSDLFLFIETSANVAHSTIMVLTSRGKRKVSHG